MLLVLTLILVCGQRFVSERRFRDMTTEFENQNYTLPVCVLGFKCSSNSLQGLQEAVHERVHPHREPWHRRIQTGETQQQHSCEENQVGSKENLLTNYGNTVCLFNFFYFFNNTLPTVFSCLLTCFCSPLLVWKPNTKDFKFGHSFSPTERCQTELPDLKCCGRG